MPTDQTDSAQSSRKLVFSFFLLLGIYPFLSFFWRRDYPLLSGEFFLLASLIVACSLLLSVLIPRLHAAIVPLVTASIISVMCLVQFNLQSTGVLVLLAVSMLLAWVFKFRFYWLGIPVLMAMLAGALVDSRQSPYSLDLSGQNLPVQPDTPPVIHILLDSFIGLDGLPPYPASELFHEGAEQFMREFGFKVFPRAYSRYPATGDSLYSAMNFRDDDNTAISAEVSSRQAHVLKSNAYFDALERLGYRFNIYQTAHLNFCESHPDSMERCWNYGHPNVLTVRHVPGVGRRAGMLAKVMLTQSSILTRASQGLVFDPAIAVHDPRVLQSLERDLLADPGGRVFFAHLLMPHGPFAYLNDCSVQYEPETRFSYANVITDGDNLHPDIVEYRTMRYFEQADCALLTLRRFFAGMKARQLFDRSYIVLHGDHGSMVSKTLPYARNRKVLTIEDYRAKYSTLFAVKRPFGEFESDSRALPLSALLRELSMTLENDRRDEQGQSPVPAAPLADESSTLPFVYLSDTRPFTRVDINIFETPAVEESNP